MDNLIDVTMQYIPELEAVLPDFSLPELSKSLVPSSKRPEIVVSKFGKRNTNNGLLYILKFRYKTLHLMEKKGDITLEIKYSLAKNTLIMNEQEMGDLVKRHFSTRIKAIVSDIMGSKAAVYAKTRSPLPGTIVEMVKIKKLSGAPKIIRKKAVSYEMESSERNTRNT